MRIETQQTNLWAAEKQFWKKAHSNKFLHEIKRKISNNVTFYLKEPGNGEQSAPEVSRRKKINIRAEKWNRNKENYKDK